MIKVCAISDLHGILPEINECDLCLIAGDIVPLDIQRQRTESIVWFFKTFLPWIKKLPCREVFMVAGNHDFLLESDYSIAKALEYLSDFKLTYLKNDCATFRTKNGKNIKVYGSPQCHKFGNWAFMHDEPFLEGLYKCVDDDIDIWLTHDTPMLKNLDLLPPSKWNPEPIHAGGGSLAAAICRVKPRYVFCGHLHTCKDKYAKIVHSEKNEILGNKKTHIYNVSILNNSYAHVYEPTYVEIC